jgi:hypothetical protein
LKIRQILNRIHYAHCDYRKQAPEAREESDEGGSGKAEPPPDVMEFEDSKELEEANQPGILA